MLAHLSFSLRPCRAGIEEQGAKEVWLLRDCREGRARLLRDGKRKREGSRVKAAHPESSVDQTTPPAHQFLLSGNGSDVGDNTFLEIQPLPATDRRRRKYYRLNRGRLLLCPSDRTACSALHWYDSSAQSPQQAYLSLWCFFEHAIRFCAHHDTQPPRACCRADNHGGTQRPLNARRFVHHLDLCGYGKDATPSVRRDSLDSRDLRLRGIVVCGNWPTAKRELWLLVPGSR